MTNQRLSLLSQGLELEYAWFEPAGAVNPADSKPVLVLLHEGLGCLAMWRQFPQQLAQACGLRVFAYSRQGYGTSTPLQGARPLHFMRDEALQILPAVLHAASIDAAILVGHSDGASIALLAAPHLAQVKGVVSMAAHLFGEALTFDSIAQAKAVFEDPASGLRERLARYHQDVDGAFYGWCNVWLHDEFRQWSIRDAIADPLGPVLAVQGEQDQYGTMAQMQAIQTIIPGAELLKLAQCRHSPQFDQPDAVIAAIQQFCQDLRR